MQHIVLAALCCCIATFAALANGQTSATDSTPSPAATEWELYPARHLVGTPVPPDSSDVQRLQKKAFWRASAETVGFNIGLWAFDRYVQKGHYAYINFETIKENFKHGFEWDNDHLGTNMFAHPYNGSLFYNAGRSNGYNFWQSGLFAIGGSAMWEMFMECEYPSTNDIIATPIGGAAIGEVLYRTSDLVLDDRTTGGRRFGRELAAFILSPMRGFTRIVTGRAWEKRSTTGRRFGLPPISIDLSLGTRMLLFHDKDNLTKAGAAMRVNIEYGDPFTPTTTPYDNFSFLIELNAMKTQPLLSRVEIMGRLLSTNLIEKPNSSLSVGMYQHFDYFDSDTISDNNDQHFYDPCTVPYKFGTPASLGGGAVFRYTNAPFMQLDAYAHVNGIIMGGVLSDFYRNYNRNYNWGSGYAAKAGVNLHLFKQRLSISVKDQYYKLFTWKGYDPTRLDVTGEPVNVQGNYSTASFNHLEAMVSCRLWHRIYATVGVDYYYRFTNYENYPDHIEDGNGGYFNGSNLLISSKQVGIYAMLTYKF